MFGELTLELVGPRGHQIGVPLIHVIYPNRPKKRWLKRILERVGIDFAVTSTDLTAGGIDTNDTTGVTASIAPSANKLVLACCTGRGSAIGTCSAAGGGMTTWTEVANRIHGTLDRTYLFRSLQASPSSGALTFTWTTTLSNRTWSVVEFGNVLTTGTNGADAIRNSAVNSAASVSTLSVTLPAFGDTDNATYGVFGLNRRQTTFTPGSGFTGLTVGVPATEANSCLPEWKNSNDTGVNASWADATSTARGIAVEIVENIATVSARAIITNVTQAIKRAAAI